MKITFFDRILRLIIGEVLIVGYFFWLSGGLGTTALVLSLILLASGLSGFCPLYKLIKHEQLPFASSAPSTLLKVTLFFVVLLVGCVSSYYSNFFTKKFFLEDYNQMNHFYKQTLFYTGQENRDEAVNNYKLLQSGYEAFLAKYLNYHPYALRRDTKLNQDLLKVHEIIVTVADTVQNGDLKVAHTRLEGVRPILQDILKRNSFSPLAVYLVDFHDAMENVLTEANNKSSTGVQRTYTNADEKLNEIEAIENDQNIQNIRLKLEEVLKLAQEADSDHLPEKASELKSAFVKVYLERG